MIPIMAIGTLEELRLFLSPCVWSCQSLTAWWFKSTEEDKKLIASITDDKWPTDGHGQWKNDQSTSIWFLLENNVN